MSSSKLGLHLRPRSQPLKKQELSSSCRKPHCGSPSLMIITRQEVCPILLLMLLDHCCCFGCCSAVLSLLPIRQHPCTSPMLNRQRAPRDRSGKARSGPRAAAAGKSSNGRPGTLHETAAAVRAGCCYVHAAETRARGVMGCSTKATRF